jgi:hypothetical protein
MLHICGVSKTLGESFKHTVGNVHKASGNSAKASLGIDRVTAVLRSIPKEAFADSFQKLYERCQPCVVKDDDY